MTTAIGALSPRALLSAAMVRACDGTVNKITGQPSGIAPYFASILHGLIRREMTDDMRSAFEAMGKKPTIGVTRDGVLIWAPEFVASCSTEELALVLVHEAMHVAMEHAKRGEALGIVPDCTPDKLAELITSASRWNKAADCAINDQLRKIGTLPHTEHICFPEKFGLPPNLTAEEYYYLLQEQEQKQEQGGGKGAGKGQGKGGKPSAGEEGAGHGHCGGVACRPLPGEDPAGKDPEGRSEVEMERFRHAAAEAVRDFASKHRGLVPAGLERWADDKLKPARIPWQEKLGRLVRGAVAYKAGAVDYTWSRVSRRQAGVGFGPGRPVVPALHAPKPRVAVVVDTSGSMGEQQLGDALSETQGILSSAGAEVVFCVCDAEVHGIKEVGDIREAMGMLKGGAGTAMAPALQAVADLKQRPSVCVVMTDGYIDDPPEPPFAVVWCIVGGERGFTRAYGDVVFVDDGDRD